MIFIFIHEDKFRSSFEEADVNVKKISILLREHTSLLVKLEIVKLDYVLRELFNNAVEHGNKGQKDKYVGFVITLSPQNFVVDVYDEGEGFEMSEVIYKDKNINRERNRGLESLLAMAFKIEVCRGHVRATLNLGI